MRLSNRKVERAMGLSDSYLSRVFSGAIALRVSHVVEIARVLNVEPEEVFAVAFRHMPAAHSSAYELVRVALQDLRPPA
ncbi:MAG TPA: helix-turn-helix transcriptional regulator, partial [Thermoanaerobaculia bacterium]